MWSNQQPPPRHSMAPALPPPFRNPPHMNAFPPAHSYPPSLPNEASPGPADWAKLAQSWMAQRTTTLPVDNTQPNYSHGGAMHCDYVEDQQAPPAVYMEHSQPMSGYYSGPQHNSSIQPRPPPPPPPPGFNSAPLHGPSRAPPPPPFFRPHFRPAAPPVPYYQPPSHFHPNPPVQVNDVPHQAPISASIFTPDNVMADYHTTVPPVTIPTPTIQYGTFTPQPPLVGHFNPLQLSQEVGSVDSVPIVYDHEHGNVIGHPVPIKSAIVETVPQPFPDLDYHSLHSKSYPNASAPSGGSRRLPSWLRAELEKLESKKRQEQTVKGSGDGNSTNGEKMEEEEDDQSYDNHGVVMHDVHESEDLDQSDAISSPRRSTSASPHLHSAPSPGPLFKNLSEEERMEEELIFIRVTLTELLLETTKELIYDTAVSACNAARGLSSTPMASHSSEHRMPAYNALKGIQYNSASEDEETNRSHVAGLVAYGSDESDAEDNSAPMEPSTKSLSSSREVDESHRENSHPMNEDLEETEKVNSQLLEGKGNLLVSPDHGSVAAHRNPSPGKNTNHVENATFSDKLVEKDDQSESALPQPTDETRRKRDHRSRDSHRRRSRSSSTERHSKRKKKHKRRYSSESYSEESTQQSKESGTSKRNDRKKDRKQKKSKKHRHRSSSRSASRSPRSRKHEKRRKRSRS